MGRSVTDIEQFPDSLFEFIVDLSPLLSPESIHCHGMSHGWVDHQIFSCDVVKLLELLRRCLCNLFIDNG